MSSVKRDFSILDRFDFERKPVGIKFLLNRPEGLEPLNERMPICRMLGRAFDGSSFCASEENFSCVDRLVLGVDDPDPVKISGQIGAKEHIYQDARANRRIYQHIETIQKGTVRHVAFSPIDKMSFDPDLMILAATPFQAEILLRALSYTTGKPLTTKMTPVLMCAWVFAYPYMTGEINYVITGIGYGMRIQKIMPEGFFLISVPYDKIPMLMENLGIMDWELPINKLNEKERGEFAARIMAELKQEFENG